MVAKEAGKREPRFNVGQVVMGRIDGVFVPWIVEKEVDDDWPSCVLVRHRRHEKFLMEPDRLRPLTKREATGK